MGRTYSKSLTPEERLRLARIRARIAAKKFAEDTEDDIDDKVENPLKDGVEPDDAPDMSEDVSDETPEIAPDEDESEKSEPDKDEDTEEKAKAEARRAYRRAYRRAMRRYAQDADELKHEPEDNPDADADEKKDHQEPDGDEVETKEECERRAARKRAVAARKRAEFYRRAAIRRRKRAAEGDLDIMQKGEVSDDLANPDEGDGGIEQKPQPQTAEGLPAEKAQTEDANQNAQEVVLSAYDLIDAQIAHQVVSPNVRRSSLASQYTRKYTAKQMRFATEQLNKVGSAGKTASNVRISRRGPGGIASRTASNKGSGFDSECLFY